MNPGRYFMPMVGRSPMMYANGMTLRNYGNFNVFGLLNKLTNGIKNFNWRGLLGGMSKTLNVVNQTIPLVRQAKPMFDNVKSMVLLTKTFNNETRNIGIKKGSVNTTSLSKKKKYQVNNGTGNFNARNMNRPIFFV